MTWLLTHWLLLAVGGTGVLAFLFPAVSLPIGRWLLLTERGRYLLLAMLVAASFLWYRAERFAVGYAAGVAHETAATDRARAAMEQAARLTEQRHAKDMADLAAQYERDKADAQLTQARVVADLRAGNLRLRDAWRCDVPEAAAAPGVSDGRAIDRSEAAGRVIGIGADADAQLKACQAVIRADRL